MLVKVAQDKTKEIIQKLSPQDNPLEEPNKTSDACLHRTKLVMHVYTGRNSRYFAFFYPFELSSPIHAGYPNHGQLESTQF